jgi:hypothetical protein
MHARQARALIVGQCGEVDIGHLVVLVAAHGRASVSTWTRQKLAGAVLDGQR